jgi:hypothetical protein
MRRDRGRAARRVLGTTLAKEAAVRVLTHAAAAPGRERCALLRDTLRHTRQAWHGGRGDPVERDTTEGVPADVRLVSQGTIATAVLVAQVNDRTSLPQGTGPTEALSQVLGTGERGARDDDEGRQKSATFEVRAAPADEARAVHRSGRREAPTLQ